MFRAKREKDAKEMATINRNILKLGDRISDLKCRVYELEKENGKLHWILNNPPEFKVGDVLKGEVLISLNTHLGCTGYGWHYEWVEVNKVKNK